MRYIRAERILSRYPSVSRPGLPAHSKNDGRGPLHRQELSYGDHLAESLIGSAIARDRADWIVATKFGHRFHGDRMASGGWSPGSVRSDHWSPADVLEQLERSLAALRPDYIDLYLFHSGADEVFDRDDLRALGWCLRQPAVDAIITGTKSVDQLESSVVAVELAVGSEG